MISVELARDGHPVLKKSGRLLGSSFEPLKEAKKWAQMAAATLLPDETVFVLGLGTGHHVVELLNLIDSSRVIVIETDGEVARHALRLCPSLPRDRVIVEAEPMGLIANELFCDEIGGIYRIAKFGPSFQIDGEAYRAIESLLLGRERISFLFQLKARPALWSLLDAERVADLGRDVSASADLISIKTLQTLFSQASGGRRERQIWRVLEELVV